jgi:hypothetical protein
MGNAHSDLMKKLNKMKENLDNVSKELVANDETNKKDAPNDKGLIIHHIEPSKEATNPLTHPHNKYTTAKSTQIIGQYHIFDSIQRNPGTITSITFRQYSMAHDTIENKDIELIGLCIKKDTRNNYYAITLGPDRQFVKVQLSHLSAPIGKIDLDEEQKKQAELQHEEWIKQLERQQQEKHSSPPFNPNSVNACSSQDTTIEGKLEHLEETLHDLEEKIDSLSSNAPKKQPKIQTQDPKNSSPIESER